MNDIVLQTQYSQTSRDPGDIVRVVDGAKTSSTPATNNSRCFIRITDSPYTEDQLQGVAAPWLVPNVPYVAPEPAYRVEARSRFYLDQTEAYPQTLLDLESVRTVTRSWAVIRPYIMDKSTGLMATDAALGLV